MIHYIILALFVAFMAYLIIGFNTRILEKNKGKDDETTR